MPRLYFKRLTVTCSETERRLRAALLSKLKQQLRTELDAEVRAELQADVCLATRVVVGKKKTNLTPVMQLRREIESEAIPLLEQKVRLCALLLSPSGLTAFEIYKKDSRAV
jgi:hypothetical protein